MNVLLQMGSIFADEGFIFIVELTCDADVLIVLENSRIEIGVGELFAEIVDEHSPVEVIFNCYKLYPFHEEDIVAQCRCLQEELVCYLLFFPSTQMLTHLL